MNSESNGVARPCDRVDISEQAKIACEACRDRGVCPVIRGGQGRTASEIWGNGWVILAVWSLVFFLLGVGAGAML